MMAQYSRQVNMDTETMEDRSLSPTCEVLSDEARTVFVSPSLAYRVRYTSLWKGRSGLEKLLMVIVAFLLLFSCSCLIVLLVTKQVSLDQKRVGRNKLISLKVAISEHVFKSYSDDHS